MVVLFTRDSCVNGVSGSGLWSQPEQAGLPPPLSVASWKTPFPDALVFHVREVTQLALTAFSPGGSTEPCL